MHITCPACGAGVEAEPFFRVAKVPVQSVRLVARLDAALSFPSASVSLTGCPGCGFVFNQEFDAEAQHWDPDYEETQVCSDHFNRFAAQLVNELIERYQLQGKRILEIGCGKGHFLAALCSQGGNIGLGVDPAFDPARNPSLDGTVSYRQETFSEAHLEFEPNLVMCRHTLEHISDPSGLLGMIAARRGCDVVIEVPDSGRILDEGAFWDIYYEHCGYFDAGSLARVMNQAGIGCQETVLGFHDQYLLAFGRTGLPADDFPPVGSLAGAGDRLQHCLENWRGQLQHWRSAGDRVVLWGGGSKAVGFLTTLGTAAEGVSGVIDINPRKQDHFLPGSGHPVWAPERLIKAPPDHIVVMNPAYRQEISDHLDGMGLASSLVDVTLPPVAVPVP